jgi:hypothetical protein
VNPFFTSKPPEDSHIGRERKINKLGAAAEDAMVSPLPESARGLGFCPWRGGAAAGIRKYTNPTVMCTSFLQSF